MHSPPREDGRLRRGGRQEDRRPRGRRSLRGPGTSRARHPPPPARRTCRSAAPHPRRTARRLRALGVPPRPPGPPGRPRPARPAPPAPRPARAKRPCWRLPAALERDPGGRVATGRDRPGQPRDNVDHHVAQDDDAAHEGPSATATRAASPALRRTSRTFASRLAPPVSLWKRSSRKGVTSLPATPSPRRARGRRRAPGRAAHGRAARPRARVGHDDRAPLDAHLIARRMTAATSSGESTRHGAGCPESAR